MAKMQFVKIGLKQLQNPTKQGYFANKIAEYGHIFTMSKYGRLEFQRFQTRLEKVRDYGAHAELKFSRYKHVK